MSGRGPGIAATTRCDLYDGSRSTRHCGSPVVVPGADQMARPVLADQPADEVEEARARRSPACRRPRSPRGPRRRRGSTSTRSPVVAVSAHGPARSHHACPRKSLPSVGGLSYLARQGGVSGIAHKVGACRRVPWALALAAAMMYERGTPAAHNRTSTAHGDQSRRLQPGRVSRHFGASEHSAAQVNRGREVTGSSPSSRQARAAPSVLRLP